MKTLFKTSIGILTGIAGAVVTALLVFSLAYNVGALTFTFTVRPLGLEQLSEAIDVNFSDMATALLVMLLATLAVGISGGVLVGRWILERGGRKWAAFSVIGCFTAIIVYLCVDPKDAELNRRVREFQSRDVDHIDKETLYLGFRTMPELPYSKLGTIGNDTEPIGDDAWLKENVANVRHRWEECSEARAWMDYVTSLRPYDCLGTSPGSPFIDFHVAQSVTKARIRYGLLLVSEGDLKTGVGEIAEVARFGQTLQGGSRNLVGFMVGVVVERMALENLLRIAESNATVGHSGELEEVLGWDTSHRNEGLKVAFEGDAFMIIRAIEESALSKRGFFGQPLLLVFNLELTKRRIFELLSAATSAIIADDQEALKEITILQLHDGLPPRFSFKNMVGELTAQAAIPPSLERTSTSLKTLARLHQQLAERVPTASGDAISR